MERERKKREKDKEGGKIHEGREHGRRMEEKIHGGQRERWEFMGDLREEGMGEVGVRVQR
jgi:hypothetical protein